MSSPGEPSPLLIKTVRVLLPAILWFDRTFFRLNRLEKIKRVELEAPLSKVIELYGDPIESKPHEDFDEATSHTFSVAPFHEVVIKEWKGKACLITYWSSHPAPSADLKCMLETYGEEVGWENTEAGYWYFRKDGRVRIWCSAMPAIGVATTEFLIAESDAKKAKKTVAEE